MDQELKNTAKAAGAAALVVAAASASAYLTTKLLVDTALDRKPPRVMKNASKYISGSKSKDSLADVKRAADEKLKNSENEHVTIKGHDGTTLVGHFIPCENQKRVVIAVHGWRSSWYKDFGGIADFLSQDGSSVLYIEQRGQNGSGGDHMGFGLTERYDCLDWINFVKLRCGSDVPVYLMGVSMGAATVLMASGLDLPSNVHGIVADCGFTSPDAIFRHVAKNNLHIAYRLRSVMADKMFRKKIMIGSGEYSTTDALKTATVPVMFIHGTNDHFVPIEMTYQNYLSCASEKKLLVVPGADHAMSCFVDPEKYKEGLEEFFAKYDTKA